jgi:hypothetical protein
MLTDEVAIPFWILLEGWLSVSGSFFKVQTSNKLIF